MYQLNSKKINKQACIGCSYQGAEFKLKFERKSISLPLLPIFSPYLFFFS